MRKDKSKTSEMISIQPIVDDITEQIGYLNSLIQKTAKSLDGLKNVPDRSIFIHPHYNSYQYYVKDPEGNKKKYVRSSEKDLVKKIAQKQYDLRMLKWMKNTVDTLTDCAEKLDDLYILKSYESMGPGRKALVSPVVMTDEMFADLWMEKYPGEQNQKYGQGVFKTQRGELVRSKSEKILADTFYNLKVPYQYEPELKLGDGSVFYPDFVLLNIKRRKTLLWEHLGMISDSDYATKSLSKIRIYESNGILLGRDLIITEESSESPLKTRDIETKLRTFVLC